MTDVIWHSEFYKFHSYLLRIAKHELLVKSIQRVIILWQKFNSVLSDGFHSNALICWGKYVFLQEAQC